MEQITLTPVDGVEVTTVVDNSSDVLMPTRAWSAGGVRSAPPGRSR